MKIGDLLKNEIERVAKNKASDMTCPKCRAGIDFVEQGSRYYYVCRKFPQCKHVLGAKPTGEIGGNQSEARLAFVRSKARRAIVQAIDSGVKENDLKAWLCDESGASDITTEGMSEYAAYKVLACIAAAGKDVAKVASEKAAAMTERAERLKTQKERELFVRGILKVPPKA